MEAGTPVLLNKKVFMKSEEQNAKPHREGVCPTKKGKLDLDAARARVAEMCRPVGRSS